MTHFIIAVLVLLLGTIAASFHPLWQNSPSIRTKCIAGLLICFGVVIPFIALYLYFGAPAIIPLTSH